MKIQIGAYTLEQEVNSPTKFNLSFARVVPDVNKATGQPNKNAGELQNETLAYAVTIQHAIELIASYELLENDTVVSLKEYVDQFNDQLKRFDSLLTASR